MDQIRITHSAISYLEMDTKVVCFDFNGEESGIDGGGDVVEVAELGAFAVVETGVPLISDEDDSFP